MHLMRQIAETQKLSAATSIICGTTLGIFVNHHPRREFVSGCIWYKRNNVLSGLKHLRTHEYVGQPPVNVVDWTVMKAVTPVKNREQCDSR